ncbi:unnamed protein product [Eruca vesicaria subsp. sativa]|uniref:RING-type E3 ubiquitin transferase n=1 Tax=Eruca vesicaria subsp. sativa TaxID=29727 RepID=A0ABC8KXA8_ERUVS|nr:unnamed protein product [Eruca vesicaria subsp. sativa]
MARFSVSGGDDGEGSSNHQSRKRQRLPSIDEDEETAGSSDEEEDDRLIESTSDDSDREVVIEEARRISDPVTSQIASTKDSSLSVTLLDPDVLDCPICCEPLKIPIFQCDNGHLACSVCCAKVRNICPSCTLPVGYIRCRAMEKVIETSRVSCPNAKYGCKEKMLYGDRFSHEKLCAFAPCSCPVLNCNYTGYYKDLNSHVRAKHKDEVIPFVWDVSVTIRLDKTTILQEEKDGEVMVVQVFRGLHVVYVVVSCLAPSAQEVGTFSYYLVTVPLAVDGSLVLRSMMKNTQKLSNEQPEDGFMVIPSYMLSGSSRILLGRGRAYGHA